MFDWATPGKLEAPPLPEVHTYRRSERALEISQHNFHELLSGLAATMGRSQCIMIGHSMGNRMICEDLLRRDSERDLVIEQIHLVRPDLSIPAYVLDEKQICRFAKRVYIYIADNDPWLRLSQSFSADVPRLGCPQGFFELAMRQGMTLDRPLNRYFLDIAALNGGHDIPSDLIDSVIRTGVAEQNSRYTMTPWSEEHTKRQLIRVQRGGTDGKARK